MPGTAERGQPGKMPRVPSGPLVPRRPRRSPVGLPKAKRSNRPLHDRLALIQKVKGVSARVFASDYLCLVPRPAASGSRCSTSRSTSRRVLSFILHFPVHICVDCGVYTGAVWFQVRPRMDGRGVTVTVFADYLSEGLGAEKSAGEIRRQSETLCGIGWDRARVSTDPAGNSRTAIGPTVRAEYLRPGSRERTGWSRGRQREESGWASNFSRRCSCRPTGP